MEEIKLDVKTLETPNLVVSEKRDAGTIKISGVPENVSKKSINFGPGLDLLMNPSRTSRPNSPKSEINLSDISELDKNLNKNLKSPREMRDKVFSSGAFGSGFTAPPSSPEMSATGNLKAEPIKLNLDKIKLNPGESKLGENSTNLEGKENTWDGMKKFNSGHIINIGSIGAKYGSNIDNIFYGVSKKGIESATKTLARNGSKYNILVNTVCIGLIKAGQHERRVLQMHNENPSVTLESFYAERGEAVPLGRVGEAREAGDVICFLASERASYLTGTSINIDGGTSGVL